MKRAALKGLDSVEDIPIEKKVRSPLPHQASALDAWAGHHHRGIFKHATGSGKTFTAILALRDQVARNQPAIVLVPSRLLLMQWAEELRHEIPNATLLLAGAGNNKWKTANRLEGMTSLNGALGGRIVLSTMATAASDAFRTRVSQALPNITPL